MEPEEIRARWNWEDPRELSTLVDEVTEELGRCEKLELLASGPSYTRQQLQELGITGIEFAAFKTDHPAGLGTDIVSVQSGDMTTTRGPIYRVDGTAMFTELDISEQLPFEDDSIEWAFAEHLIEHVTLTAGVTWLTEVRRILAPGGVIRITTPDLRKYAESYVNGDGFFGKHRRRMNRALGPVAPAMPERGAFMFNQLFYVYGHRWIFDEAELRYLFACAGFAPETVTVHSYRVGARQDVADLDQVLRNDESIYIEAIA
jgi:predicted SAM-dependent methyltransferase